MADASEAKSEPSVESEEKPEPSEVFKVPSLAPSPLKSNEAEGSAEKSEKTEKEEAPRPLKMSVAHPVLEYDPPPWACEPPPDAEYKLEVIKNGAIVETIDLNKRKHGSYIVIGRIEFCDVVMENPSISRYHCVLQYGEDTMGKSGKGWHLFDLGSSHGTKANRQKMPAQQYIRMQIGWVIQCGMSSRSFTLLGPEEERESEWDLSPTEMMERMKKKALERKLAAQAKAEFEEQRRKESQEAKDEGIDWGMDYEVGDSGLLHIEGTDAHLMEDHEAYYREDPKKALAKFFDREGFDMEFTYSESGVNTHNHKWTCTIELPVDPGNGRSLVASATVPSGKKDAQVQCALEACRILDQHGVLRKSTARAKLKKKTLEDNDFYDEDDDIYLDRTGQIEQQREKRRLRALGQAKAEPKRETYESLLAKLDQTKRDMEQINKKLSDLSSSTVKETADAGDSLDEFCAQLNKGASGAMEDLKTKTEKSTLRQKLVALTHEAQKLEKLVKIAKPVSLPELKVPGGGAAGAASTASAAEKQALMRKMMNLSRKNRTGENSDASKKTATPVVVQQPQKKNDTSEFVPEQDDDEELSSESKGMQLPPGLAPSSTRLTPEEPSENPSIESIDGSDVTEREQKLASPSTSSADNDNESSQSQSLVEAPAKKSPVRQKRTLEQLKADNEAAEREAEAELEVEAEKKRRKRVYKPREKKVETAAEYGDGCVDKDEQYATWLPPENQAGDGSTKLNAKFAGRY